MKTKWTMLVAGLLAGLPVAGRAADPNLRPLVVTNLSGELRIEQDLPSACGDVDQATPVTGGRLEITPAEGYEAGGGARRFDLIRASVTFAPFLVRRSCYTHSEARDYTALAVQLGVAAAPMEGAPAGPDVFTLSASRDDVVFYEAATVNGRLETGYKRPSEDLTGTLDLAGGTASFRVVIATKIHIKGGCVPVIGCAVDDDYHGTLTATISGTLVFPDADEDGVPDRDDNCALVANRDQRPVANPVVRPPADLTVSSCAVSRIGLGTVIDICDLKTASVGLSNDAPGLFVPGPNRVTWRGVTDRSANTAAQVVTVADAVRPEFTAAPADIALTTCTPGRLTAPAAIDDCGGPVVTSNAPAVFPPGRSVVTWTAADASGNRANVTQGVAVVDGQAPVAICAAVPSAPGIFQVAARDDCGAATLRLGTYVLAYGERIGIRESRLPGVRLVGNVVVGGQRLRAFEAGPGEAVVAATDGSGNVGTASCGAPARE